MKYLELNKLNEGTYEKFSLLDNAILKYKKTIQ